MGKNKKKINGIKLIALVLILFPIISIFGVIIYAIDMLKGNWTLVELIILILTIPFGFLAGIFLWLNALGVINI